MSNQSNVFVPGKKYKRRDGVVVTFIGVNPHAPESERLIFSFDNGRLTERFYAGWVTPADTNLGDILPEDVKEPIKVECWVNIYSNNVVGPLLHESKQEALRNARKGCIATIYLSGTEGVEPE